jgi:hypothetical protein
MGRRLKGLLCVLCLLVTMPTYAQTTKLKVPTPPQKHDIWKDVEQIPTSTKTSGLYDDILGSSAESKSTDFGKLLQSRYDNCKTQECVDRVHRENLEILNDLYFDLLETRIENLEMEVMHLKYGY